MVKVITLYQDITFTETIKKVEQDKVLISKKPLLEPNFKTGTSVFRERPFSIVKKILMFWKRPRQLIIWVDGCPTALNLELKEDQKPAYNLNFGTIKETVAFIDKVQRKSKADMKPISNNQFLVIAPPVRSNCHVSIPDHEGSHNLEVKKMPCKGKRKGKGKR